MAIIIPSKNIYSKQNPKIRDNFISKVSVNQNVVTPNNEYEVSVYNKKLNNNDIVIFNGDKIFGINQYAGVVDGSNVILSAGTYIEITPRFVTNLQITINKLAKNKYINYLYLDKNKDDEYNIKITIHYGVQKGTASGKFKVDLYNGAKIKDINPNYKEEVEEQTKQFKPLTKEELSNTIEVNAFNSITSSVYDEFYEKYGENGTVGNYIENISGRYLYNDDEENDTFNFALSFLYDYEKITLQGKELNAEDFFVVNGFSEKYIAKQVEITVYGNTVGINLEDGTVTYIKDGTNGDKPISLNGNELMQDSDSATTGDKPTTEFLAQNVLEQYKSGKETAVLRCDIANYFEENGEKAISIDFDNKPMLLEIGDEVVPMVRAVDGTDRPMSKKQDGTAKSFIIVGKEPIYSGAVWQEITLQEK